MSDSRLFFAGDVMCGDSFYALGSGVRTMLEEQGDSFMPCELAEYISSHDMAFCNVECVLSDVGEKRYSLRSMHEQSYSGAWY